MKFPVRFVFQAWIWADHTPEGPVGGYEGHIWVCHWADTGNPHRVLLSDSQPHQDRRLSPRGSADFQLPATERLAPCSPLPSTHLKSHCQRRHNRVSKSGSVWWMKKESFLRVTCLCRDIFPKWLWSAAAGHGAGCGCRCPEDPAAVRWAGGVCSCALRWESWQPEL